MLVGREPTSINVERLSITYNGSKSRDFLTIDHFLYLKLSFPLWSTPPDLL